MFEFIEGFDSGGGFSPSYGLSFYDPNFQDPFTDPSSDWYTKPATTLGVNLPNTGFNPTIRIGSTGQTPNYRDQAVSIVNQAEPYFKQNRDQYLSQPATRDSQITALSRFDSLWQSLVANLSRLGAEGQAAIRDRSPGGGHSWYGYYRDPIEKDPRLGPISGTTPGVNATNIPILGDIVSGTNSGQYLLLAVIAIAVILIVKAVK